MTELHARLDKTGTRVLCGRVSCGTELARVGHGSHHPRPPGMDRRGLDLLHGPQDRIVLFGPGWDRSPDGTWHLTSYGWKRWRRGGRPKYRRTPPGYRGGPAPLGLEAGEAVGMTTLLPARAACPSCRRFQTLDPDVLNALGVAPGFLMAWEPRYVSKKPRKE